MPFFLLKGLSFLPFGGILKNPKVLIGVIIVVVLAFGIYKWKSSIKEAIYNELFSEQVEQHMENQRKELERTRQLLEEGTQAVDNARKERQKLLTEIEDARTATRNVTSDQNGPVAPVLSEALNFIRERETAAGNTGESAVEGVSEPREETLKEKLSNAVDSSLEALKGAKDSVTETGNSAIDAWKKKQEEGS